MLIIVNIIMLFSMSIIFSGVLDDVFSEHQTEHPNKFLTNY